MAGYLASGPGTRKPRNGGNVGFKHRGAFKLLTASNHKTPKGETLGFFSAVLYLMPHTSGGGSTLCPHSTPACREMCLAGAGLSGLPKQLGAKMKRTKLFNEDRPEFLRLLLADIAKLERIAAAEGMRPALRLNGSSDVLWERVIDGWSDLGLTRYDYTKIPLEHRQTDPGYHLTFSIEGPQDMRRAVGYLRAGHSVAAVVPEDVKHNAPSWIALGEDVAEVIDGDLTDARFLDPPSSIVLLKPKGHIRTDLIRPNLFEELRAASGSFQRKARPMTKTHIPLAKLPDGREADAETMAKEFANPGDHIRQGDVLLIKRASKPQGAGLLPREQGSVVLAHGEVTGHMHQLRGPQVTHYRDSGHEYMTVVNKPEALVHEEHGGIFIPPSDTELGQQVEYTPAELRNVAD
jgi:hypothetical protein